jgi:hypothetical protein
MVLPHVRVNHVPSIVILILAAACITAGSTNVIAAWQEAHSAVIPNPAAGPVRGWDTPPVVLVTAIAILLVLATAFAISQGGKRWAVATGVLATVPVAVLWFDALVAGSTPGIVEGGGPRNLWNVAHDQLFHAGGLFAASIVLCLAALWWLDAQSRESSWARSGQ